jgi:glycosyltransferase involved in cell wall biosynthesis
MIHAPAAPLASNTAKRVVMHARVVRGSGGGPEKTILNSPRFLTPHGYQALCLYLRPPHEQGFEEIIATAERCRAPLIAVDDHGPWDTRVIWRLLGHLKQHRVAIWHAHDYKSNALGLLLRRFWPMRLVTTVHGWVHFTRRTRLYYAIDRLCLRHYERVICVSADLWRRCVDAGVPSRRCHLIENAIDTSRCTGHFTKREARRRLGLPEDASLIGACGRLSAEKGFRDLILAVERLLPEHPELHLVLAGEGEERGRLSELIGRRGRQDRIHLLGYRADMDVIYQALDVFALSSLREGLPNVLLEAMAWNVPVVTTSAGGISRLIQDGINGLIVPPCDVQALAGALERLLRDAPRREAIAAAARETVEQRYSFAARMNRVRALYDELFHQQPSYVAG